MAKRVGIHRGRTNAKGVAFSANHQDRNFNFENAEHIDPSLVRKNVYMKFDDEIDKGSHQKMDDYEQAVYEKYLGTALEIRNEKQIANRHKDRVQTMEQFRRNPKFCPEEAIYTIGKFGDTVDPEIIKECFNEFVEWHKTHFPNVIFLDAALHLDEPNAAPHLHNRQLWVVERTDENGQTYLDISQKEALAAMGIERPDPTKKDGRYNNAKMTYTAICREKWIEIAESHGIEIEREPQDKSRSGLTLLKYKERTAKEEVAKAEEQLEMLNGIKDIVEQQLEKDVDALNDVKNEIAEKRETVKQLDNEIDARKLIAVEIPPRPVYPSEPPFPRQPAVEYVFTDKKAEREYKAKWNEYQRACKDRDKLMKIYDAECERVAKAQEEWDKLYEPIAAAKRQLTRAASKEREVAARELAAKEKTEKLQEQVTVQAKTISALENENITLKAKIQEIIMSAVIAAAIRTRTILEKMGMYFETGYTTDAQACDAEHSLTLEYDAER